MLNLFINDTAICCSVGYSSDSASAAIRARLDQFRETHFVNAIGEPIIGAMMPNLEFWGGKRIEWMLQNVLDELLSKNTKLDRQRIPVLAILPEMIEGLDYTYSLHQPIFEKMLSDYHPLSSCLFSGKGGIGQALVNANELLSQPEINQVIVVGADTYFDPLIINRHLMSQRIMGGDITNGFIPGEGAGALLLSHQSVDDSNIQIKGIGIGNEQSTILQDESPNLAKGLSDAIFMALKMSQAQFCDSQYLLNAYSGEDYYFKEMALAFNRTLEKWVPELPTIQITTSVGEIGAAFGPVLLSYYQRLMHIQRDKYTQAVAIFSSDSGLRTALVLINAREVN